MLDWLIAMRKGRPQWEVAREIGIAQSTYASIETGARAPSVKMAKKIGAALGFHWTRFFEDEQDSA